MSQACAVLLLLQGFTRKDGLELAWNLLSSFTVGGAAWHPLWHERAVHASRCLCDAAACPARSALLPTTKPRQLQQLHAVSRWRSVAPLSLGWRQWRNADG